MRLLMQSSQLPLQLCLLPHQLGCEGDELCVFLCIDDELSREETLRLILCDVRAIHDVGDELRPERKREVVAVDVSGLLLVDDKEIVALLADGDVGVLAHFDVALGAEDEEPSIAPGAEAVGSEPVEPDVADAAIAAKHHVAEVLEFGMLRIDRKSTRLNSSHQIISYAVFCL